MKLKKILITGGSGFIGQNLIEIINKEYSEFEIINLDLKSNNVQNECIYIKCDILDRLEIKNIFDKIQPNYIIHLAAETNCDPKLTIKDYKVNIEGSKNIFDLSNDISQLKGLIHISTQFVNQTDFPLENFTNYKPNTIYGESKVLSEKLLINANYNYNWIILRPTNVWGKWHPRYPVEFWKILQQGKYIHPHKEGVIRSYGYVGNVCDQILFFLTNINKNNISKGIYYIGDKPIELYEWVNGFSLKLLGKNVRVVPSLLVYFIALFGSLLKIINVTFPITISRYRSMTKSNPAPMEKTLNLIDQQKFSLEEGIDITVKWLNERIPH